MRVDAHQHWLITFPGIAVQQRDVRFAAIDFRLVRNQTELAIARRQNTLADPVNVALVLHAITDKLGYGEYFEIVLPAELDQIGHPSHGAIFFHDFADHARGNQSGHAGEIDCSFSLPSSYEHTAFARS